MSNVNKSGFCKGDIVVTTVLAVGGGQCKLGKSEGSSFLLRDHDARRVFKPLYEHKTYEDGLKDAWELARKICEMGVDGMKETFINGSHIDSESWKISDILYFYTPQKAKEMLDEWQAKRTIEKGDVLTNGETVGIVMENDGTDCFVLWKHIILPCRYSTRAISNMLEEGEIVKTDKNVADDLQGLWEKAEVGHV